VKVLLNTYRFLNLISIDVACGAMVGALFFAQIFQVHLLIYGICSLGITVWIIYTTDHLLDVRRLSREASTRRHQFHQKYFGLMSALLVVAILIDFYMIFHLRKAVFSWGIGLAIFVFFYLVFQRWMSPFKEIVAASLYSFGVFLPALSLQTGSVTIQNITLMILFGITALINLLLFSMFDKEKDANHAQQSFIILLGDRSTNVVVTCLFGIQVLLGCYLCLVTSYRIETVVMLTMNMVLAILFSFRDRFKMNDDYRLFGDVIFLFPLIYLVING